MRLLARLSRPGRRPGQAGFTLVELLVVLVILVLLASLVGPRVIGYLGSSRTKAAKVQIESLSSALELFRRYVEIHEPDRRRGDSLRDEHDAIRVLERRAGEDRVTVLADDRSDELP